MTLREALEAITADPAGYAWRPDLGQAGIVAWPAGGFRKMLFGRKPIALTVLFTAGDVLACDWQTVPLPQTLPHPDSSRPDGASDGTAPPPAGGGLGE